MANFLKYVDAHFYDGLTFHRVIAGFMIQAGGYDVNMTERKTEPADCQRIEERSAAT